MMEAGNAIIGNFQPRSWKKLTLFSDWLIRTKLIATILMIVASTLVFMIAGLAVYDRASFRENLVNQLTLLADVIGENSAAALAFKSREDATERLESLRGNPDIDGAVLYFLDGQVLAHYTRAGAALEIPLQLPDGQAVLQGQDRIQLFRPVTVDDRKIGTLYLDARTRALERRQQEVWSVAGVLFLASGVISIFLAVLMQRVITRPIEHLADTTRQIRKDRSYSLRAKQHSADEIGILIDNFNAMLGEIETRDRELLSNQEILENKVRERTANLEETNRRLKQEIDRRGRAELILRNHAKELESSNEELRQFAFIASHDLQEPLRKVQSFSDRLARDCGPGADARVLDSIARMQSATRRMRALIDDLLAFTRVTSQAREFSAVDLNVILNDVKNDLEVTLKQQNATLKLGPLPTLEADSGQMWQLFQNLIGNGIKFHRDGVDPVISVHAEAIESEADVAGQRWKIVVSDNGIGFDNAYREKIFKVFQRLDSKGKYQGTGIGLAICHKIVERHGGQIEAYGCEGEGARFQITLPEKQVKGGDYDAV